MKLVILNKISEEKLTEFRNAVPGSVIESYPSPRDALSHVCLLYTSDAADD